MEELVMHRALTVASMVAIILASAPAAYAADYTIDSTHSHIMFMIDHLGFAKIVGLFNTFSGTLSFDPSNVPASKLNVTIKTESLQTQFGPRDKDLKGADWFNTTEFPEMTYVGSQFIKKDEHTGTVTGKLTLHGVAKPVTLDVTVNKVGQNPLDKINSAGFSARGTLKRSDFGIKAFLGAIGDEVELIIEIEAKQKP
jgi:polyisoprenoid-binding protein YceI